MKACQYLDSNPVHSAYEANALTISSLDLISIEHLKVDCVLPECYINWPVARGRCCKIYLSCIFVICYQYRFAI